MKKTNCSLWLALTVNMDLSIENILQMMVENPGTTSLLLNAL